jgi:hypothetical protein
MATRGKNISYGHKHMATLWNPFSYKNNEPKYPDGLAQYSIGRKWTNVTRVKGKEIIIFHYPGLLGWTAIFAKTATRDITLVDVHSTSESLQYDFTTVNMARLFPDGTTQEVINQKWTLTPQEYKFSAWRTVSAAVKVKPTNKIYTQNCGKNDGWWEAIRTNKIIDPMNFLLVASTGPQLHQIPQAAVLPSLDYAKYSNSTTNWTNGPSYATAATNTMQQYVFQLNQIRNDNEFIDVTEIQYDQEQGLNTAITLDVMVYGNATMQSNPGYNIFPDALTTRMYNRGTLTSEWGRGGADPALGSKIDHPQREKGFENVKSSSFDTIIIKLHGTDDSEYLVSSVMNQEFLANDTMLKDYQTASYPALEELQEYLEIRSRDYKFPHHSYNAEKQKGNKLKF